MNESLLRLIQRIEKVTQHAEESMAHIQQKVLIFDKQIELLQTLLDQAKQEIVVTE